MDLDQLEKINDWSFLNRPGEEQENFFAKQYKSKLEKRQIIGIERLTKSIIKEGGLQIRFPFK